MEYSGKCFPCMEETEIKLSKLAEDKLAQKAINNLSAVQNDLLIRITDASDFLYRFLTRHPEEIAVIGNMPDMSMSQNNAFSLHRHKYRNLLQITAVDLAQLCDDRTVLSMLSKLADSIIVLVHNRLNDEYNKVLQGDEMAILALGKLGAGEINYSSDIDIIFVSYAIDSERHAHCNAWIRKFCHYMETRSEEGFLYRVDLNLRPYGKNAPLVMDIDATEQYYELSKEAWERFAWLRARCVVGNRELSSDLLNRIVPFVFQRTLSMSDVERFLKIKADMANLRESEQDEWNIKTGEGGIRDIEFFIQFLQILNGGHIKSLQLSNTLDVLSQLKISGLVSENEHRHIGASYLFLRRLEHRVQLLDEKQTHFLPNTPVVLARVARAMGYIAPTVEEQISELEADLLLHRNVAKQCFEQVLSQSVAME